MLNRRTSRMALTRGVAFSLCLVMTLSCGLHKATVAFD